MILLNKICDLRLQATAPVMLSLTVLVPRKKHVRLSFYSRNVEVAERVILSPFWVISWRHRSCDHVDSQYMVCYRWSIVTNPISRTVAEILNLEDLRVMTLTVIPSMRSRVVTPSNVLGVKIGGKIGDFDPKRTNELDLGFSASKNQSWFKIATAW